jgi:hypothetical protein
MRILRPILDKALDADSPTEDLFVVLSAIVAVFRAEIFRRGTVGRLADLDVLIEREIATWRQGA